ncbi:MAG: hypothetical protein JSW67_10340 [Candidatus Latescibacterota bacterium]|nr:MAG: hypothetical protein JSW67_10340 [Candidatus Latescibacterota bacterium]
MHAERFERLLEVPDLASLVNEIVEAAQALGRARFAELNIRPEPVESRRESLRTTRSRTRERATPRLRARHSRLVLPLQSGGRTWATVRLHQPRCTSLEALRSYLAHAASALERFLEHERAADQAQRYEALLDSLPDVCLLILAADDSVRNVRGQARALVGQVASDTIGRRLDRARRGRGLLTLDSTQLDELLTRARQHGRAEAETFLHGLNRDVPVQMTLVDPQGDGDLLCILRDLTAVKTMEQALLRRNRDLSEAAERLKEIDMLKNEFMSNVSHELRTPLTAIIAYAEALLLTQPDETTREEFLRVIAEQGHKLQKLIGGLLDIAKLDSLATELKLQLASLNDIIEAAAVTVRPFADKSRIRLELNLDPELQPVYLDELRSQQIVWNLLNNAIKFSPPHSSIRVRTWAEHGHVWAEVSDEGIGIAPEHQRLIFEKFVQVDGSSTRRHGGVGLGLDLVKHLVELHGGNVVVRSTPGRGSSFSFSIPIEKRQRPRFESEIDQLEGATPHA